MLISQFLLFERFVLLSSKKKYFKDKNITARNLLEHKHIIVQFTENKNCTETDVFLTNNGMEKRNALITVSNALVVPHLLENTDFVSVIGENIAKKIINNNTNITYRTMPFMKPLKINMVWHSKDRNNYSHRWLRETIISIAKNYECNNVKK
jgi:hypothetical protein